MLDSIGGPSKEIICIFIIIVMVIFTVIIIIDMTISCNIIYMYIYMIDDITRNSNIYIYIYTITIIEQIRKDHLETDKKKELLREREIFWQRTLNSIQPYGLNKRTG